MFYVSGASVSVIMFFDAPVVPSLAIESLHNGSCVLLIETL